MKPSNFCRGVIGTVGLKGGRPPREASLHVRAAFLTSQPGDHLCYDSHEPSLPTTDRNFAVRVRWQSHSPELESLSCLGLFARRDLREAEQAFEVMQEDRDPVARRGAFLALGWDERLSAMSSSLRQLAPVLAVRENGAANLVGLDAVFFLISTLKGRL